MKRSISSFTVEVRRRPSRAAAHAAPSPKWFEADPPAGGGGPDVRRAAAAAFETRSPPEPSSDTRPPAPQGRVLPSLVESVPPQVAPGEEISTLSRTNDEPDDEARELLAPRMKRPRRTTSSPVRRPPIESVVPTVMAKPNRPSEPPKALKMAAVDPGFAPKPARHDVVSPPRQPVAEATSEPAAQPTIGVSSAPAAPKKRAYVKSKFAERPSAPPSLPEPPKAAANAERSAPDTHLDDAQQAKRKRRIMGRYVYRDEFKLGELWKKRLRKTR